MTQSMVAGGEARRCFAACVLQAAPAKMTFDRAQQILARVAARGAAAEHVVQRLAAACVLILVEHVAQPTAQLTARAAAAATVGRRWWSCAGAPAAAWNIA